MADRFPLHLLPQKALSNVLLCMRSIDCLFYSQCTQRCKQSVVELNFVVSEFEITFNDTYVELHMTLPDNARVDISAYAVPHEHNNLEIAQDFLVRYGPSRGEEDGWGESVREEREREAKENEGKVEGDEIFRNEGEEEEAAQDLDNAGGPDVQEAGNVYQYSLLFLKKLPFHCTNMSFKDWFEHCKRIYHLKRIERFNLWDLNFQLDMVQVGRIVEGMRIKHVDFYIFESRDVFQQFLGLHLSVEDISLIAEPIDLNREFVKKTIFENMEGFSGGLFRNELDEMLFTNASQIHIYHDERIVGKDLNRFVRCWMRGSNRRLKVLLLTSSEDTILDETVVLRNIRHTKMSWEKFRQKLDKNGYESYEVDRVPIIRNIRSVHGRDATIAFGTNEAKFFVWN